jgi:hypothetical protein
MPRLRRRPLLRAAAVGGGAYAFGKHRQRQEGEQEQAYHDGQQSAAAVTPAPAPPARHELTAEDTQRLSELGKLHEQGILTDDEFAKQKTNILGL